LTAAPKWPAGKASADESALWKDLWTAPIAAWWHDQRVAANVVARYVRLSLSKPEHATVGQLERELGLTPASMLRMRLVVEHPEPEAEQGEDPYKHLRSVSA
jgi:hypothetical protein